MIELWGVLYIVSASHEVQRYELRKPRDRLPTPAFSGFPDRLPSGSDNKESSCNVGDLGLIPGLGRSPGGGHCKPLQYSCLENSNGQRSLVGQYPWGRKELDVTERSTHNMGVHPKSWDSCFHLSSAASWHCGLGRSLFLPPLASEGWNNCLTRRQLFSAHLWSKHCWN